MDITKLSRRGEKHFGGGGAARRRRAGRGPVSRRLHAAKQEGENQWERS